MLHNFIPENEFEYAIIEAKKHKISINSLLDQYVSNDVFVSSKSEIKEDGSGFEPLLSQDSGVPLVASFSSIDRPRIHIDVASYILQMPGKDLVARLPATYGIILNPGYSAQFIIGPDVVEELKNRGSSTSAPRPTVSTGGTGRSPPPPR